MGERTKNTIRNIVFGFGSKILSLLLPFTVRTIIIYKLGAEYVGIGSLFTSILQVLSVTELGFASAISFTMYEPIARGENEKIIESITLLKTIYKIVGLIILLAGVCLFPFLPLLIKGDIPEDVNVYILFAIYLSNTVISYLFCGYKSSILSANQRYDVISKIELIVAILRGLVQIAVLIFFSSYYLYTIAIPVFTLVSNLLVSYYSSKMFPELKTLGRWSFRGIKAIGKQIGGIALGRISLMCRNSFDSIIISALLGLTTVAMYSNYYLIVSSINGLTAVFMTSMAASVGNSLVLETIEKNEADHIKFDFYYELIIGFCTICLFSLFQPFMKIWVGDNLAFPQITMVLFCIYFYVNQLAQIRSVYSEAAGLWWHFRYLTVGEMIANIVLNIVLGIWIGVDGIILATIITAFGGSFVGCSYITYKKLFKKSVIPFFLNNGLYAIVTTVGCILIYFINIIIEGTEIGIFVVRMIITAIFAVGYLIGIYMLNKKYRAYLIDLPFAQIIKNNRSIPVK